MDVYVGNTIIVICVDNAAAAIYRVIMASQNYVPLATVLAVILKSLPLKNDMTANDMVYKCLLGVMEMNNINAVNSNDLVDHGTDPVGTEVCNDHTSTFIGEEVCCRTTHPARCTGDDRDLVADRTRQRGQALQRWTPPMPYWCKIRARVGVTARNAVSGELSGPPGAKALRS